MWDSLFTTIMVHFQKVQKCNMLKEGLFFLKTCILIERAVDQLCYFFEASICKKPLFSQHGSIITLDRGQSKMP